MPAGSDMGSGCRAALVYRTSAAGCAILAGFRAWLLPGWRWWSMWRWVLRAVSRLGVVAEAGAASAGPLGGGLTGGGEGSPGADLADVGGHQQQGGEDGLGGDAADAAAAGLGERLVGGVFGVAVEAFDGVPQGGVAGVPGEAAVGQVLAVAGAHVGRDGDRGLAA